MSTEEKALDWLRRVHPSWYTDSLRDALVVAFQEGYHQGWKEGHEAGAGPYRRPPSQCEELET